MKKVKGGKRIRIAVVVALVEFSLLLVSMIQMLEYLINCRPVSMIAEKCTV